MTIIRAISVKTTTSVSEAAYRASNWTILFHQQKESVIYHHHQHTKKSQAVEEIENSPLGPLLVQHTMTTLLATDLIAALQRHL